METENEINQIETLVERLEHLSADSIWSHRASGIRGSLLKYLEEPQNCYKTNSTVNIQFTIEQGYFVLEQAARILLMRKFNKVQRN